jgi:hypothetical protein
MMDDMMGGFGNMGMGHHDRRSPFSGMGNIDQMMENFMPEFPSMSHNSRNDRHQN